jgi:hypothetical protein
MRIGPSRQHKEGYLQGGDKTDAVVSLARLLEAGVCYMFRPLLRSSSGKFHKT